MLIMPVKEKRVRLGKRVKLAHKRETYEARAETKERFVLRDGGRDEEGRPLPKVTVRVEETVTRYRRLYQSPSLKAFAKSKGYRKLRGRWVKQ